MPQHLRMLLSSSAQTANSLRRAQRIGGRNSLPLLPPACANLPPAALSQKWTVRSHRPFSLLRKRNREPLNNSLYPVSTQCISRHLRLVKVISAQNSHYLSAFLLLFLKKGRLPLYQVVESFRPAMASAYKLAQANIAYSRFSFFFRPRYTVFL